MRTWVRIVIAAGVMLVCVVAGAVVLLYVVTGNHGASWSREGGALPFLAWGALGSVAILRRAAWAPRCMVAWSAVSSLGLAALSAAGALPWSIFAALAAGLVVVAVLLGMPRVAD